MTKRPKIRVLVVEDSDLMAREIARSLQAHDRLTVVGIASDGEAGRRMVGELEPDVVTLDVNMPKMDGLTCLQYIMIEHPTPCVVISALTGESAIETIEAYELGAVSVVEKPATIDDVRSLKLFKRRIAANVVRASHAQVRRIRRAEPKARPSRRAPRGRARRRPSAPGTIPRRLVVIGASTGGPRTLMDIVPALPADLGAAVVIVQHMPGGFTASLAERLDELSPLPVLEAEDGEVLINDHVYVAPGDFHLTLERTGVGHKAVCRLQEDAPDVMIIPSVDVALRSAIEVFDRNVVGVILTGLGDDGAEAMAHLHEIGGTTIAEAERSAVIYGMPKAVVEREAATEVVPAWDVAERVVAAIGRLGGPSE